MASGSAVGVRVRVLAWGGAAIVAGILLGIFVSFAALPTPSWPAPVILVTYMLASAVVAMVVGLIFGVPRAREIEGKEEVSNRRGRFSANSNLEQISDWLAKILVGAGLVQLTALPGSLKKLGAYLGQGLGPMGPPIVVAFVLYGFAVGFLIGYLWARLRLRVLFEASEREAELMARFKKAERIEQVKIKAVASASSTPEDARVVDRAAENVAMVTSQSRSFAPLLWVDDYPGNNVALINAMDQLGISIDQALSTDDAIEELSRSNYGLVISDLGRREGGEDNRNAGFDLLRRMKEIGDSTPVIIYSGVRAKEERAKLIAAGARDVLTSPVELYDRAVTLLARP